MNGCTHSQFKMTDQLVKVAKVLLHGDDDVNATSIPVY
jgi:hypothetical protein